MITGRRYPDVSTDVTWLNPKIEGTDTTARKITFTKTENTGTAIRSGNIYLKYNNVTTTAYITVRLNGQPLEQTYWNVTASLGFSHSMSEVNKCFPKNSNLALTIGASKYNSDEMDFYITTFGWNNITKLSLDPRTWNSTSTLNVDKFYGKLIWKLTFNGKTCPMDKGRTIGIQVYDAKSGAILSGTSTIGPSSSNPNGNFSFIILDRVDMYFDYIKDLKIHFVFSGFDGA